ncbi:serine/threonine-protein kinase TIO-like [Rutidosis leptorrhynchoides]|uniref:serine/threonine-protein kinase TIO-like n=1 Tax=Rutidosis leptorrhynchoides TaxID=125765 RepID=UPI003A998F40
MTMPFKDLDHLSIPFEHIIEATKNFTTIIGKGGYGPVYKGQISLSGETELTTVAIKRLDTRISGQGLKEFLTEIQLLSRYKKHPNLISLVGFCDQGPEKVLIYEYAHLGSLDKYLRNSRNPTCTLTWKQRLSICIDAARGLDHLHNHVAKHERVIHRDIKSANVLLDSNWRAMISDFGLSKIGRANENDSYLITNACGTHGYCDPSYQHNGILTKDSDVYSFGVVLFEVLCGRLCFYMDTQGKQRLLPQQAKSYYMKNKLNRIIDPTLREYMDSNSMNKFSKIAYQCLLDDRERRPSMDLVLQELEKALHMLLFSSGNEDNKHEIDAEVTISRENWKPICLPESWDQDIPTQNQTETEPSHSEFVATGELNSTGVVEEDSSGEYLGSSFDILHRKKSDYNDFLVKSFSDKKKSLENNGSQFGGSYITDWNAVLTLSKEVTSWAGDTSGRLVYEFSACITIVISRVAQRLKASVATKDYGMGTKDLKEILDHAKASGLIDDLLSCLVTCGTSLMSGLPNLLRAACEVCEAIWSLIDAFEIQSTKENAPMFPLSSMSSHSLDQNKINIKGDECESFIGKDYEKILETVVHEFLRCEAIRVAIFYCLRQRLIASWSSAIQIILRCCLHNDSVGRVLCGFSSSSVIGGGGDNTIISEVFSIISMCRSFDRDDSQPRDTNNLKSKVSDPSNLVLHSCLLIASVAQSIDDSQRGNTAVIMLTSSPEMQRSRLYSLCDGIQNFRPHSMSAMLALGYMCSLENNESVATSIREIAVPLIPPSATLCDYLRMSIAGSPGGGKVMLSYWHGIKDGCVLLLHSKIRWGGSLASVQDFGGCDIPQCLIDLLGNKQQHSDEIGLSPLGVKWAVDSLLFMCLEGGTSFFRKVLLTSKHVKTLSLLVSNVHLMLLRCWGGPGGGKNGVKETVNGVLHLLRVPFLADHSKDVTLIKIYIDKYIQILLEVKLPGKIIKCFRHLELKNIEMSLAVVLLMANHRSLADELVRKGLLNPSLMKRLLDDSSPTSVKLQALQLLSGVAELDEEFYKHIYGADILQQLIALLTHEDPDVRSWTLRAIGDMCMHNSYFYSLLAKHNIIGQLGSRLSDKDTNVVYAILWTTFHSNLFHEDLRLYIPQLVELLLSAETTNGEKENIAGCLLSLSSNSDKLIEDMISSGAVNALLKVVANYSVVALDPRRMDAINESPLYISLTALAKMCVHQPCRKIIRSSDVYQVIRKLRHSPEKDIAGEAILIVSRASKFKFFTNFM